MSLSGTTRATFAGAPGWLPGSGHRCVPWVALFLSAASALYWFWGDRSVLEFDRRAVDGGAWWRLLSAQLVHYGPTHAFGDIAGFVVWASLIERVSRKLLVLGLVVCAALVGGGVYVGCPHVTHFGGLSGVAVGLVVILAGTYWDRARQNALPVHQHLAVLVVLLILLKTVYEFWSGRAILASDLGTRTRLLPEAHVLGALGGVLSLALLWRGNWLRIRG